MAANHVWIETTGHSVEGHTNTAALYFNNNLLWGPKSCHDNAVDLQAALRQADPRLELRLARKDKTVEGHTRKISVRANGQNVLEGLSVHDNMDDLPGIINAVWIVNPPQ